MTMILGVIDREGISEVMLWAKDLKGAFTLLRFHPSQSRLFALGSLSTVRLFEHALRSSTYQTPVPSMVWAAIVSSVQETTLKAYGVPTHPKVPHGQMVVSPHSNPRANKCD